MARLAKSLVTLRDQVNAKWPNRSKVSDGWIGDARHAKTRSDHNPNSAGVVCALDITHDPKAGLDAGKLADAILASKDLRLGYLISNGRIANPSIKNGEWRPYSGVNAHTKHCHVSVKQVAGLYDDAKPWGIGAQPGSAPPKPAPKPRQTLKKGMTGGDVPVLQKRLKELGYYSGLIDGNFGPQTLKSVLAAQEALGLKKDGICGPATWKALDAAHRPALPAEQSKNFDPMEAVAYYQSVGWSDLASVCLVASLMWESGGNTRKPPTIIFDAHGDRDKDGVPRSHGAGQWNETAGRYKALLDYAFGAGKPWTDPQTQLSFLNRELLTTERRAAVGLRNATTLEEAMTAAIQVWRPSVPHAEKRLAIAKTLYAKLTDAVRAAG